MDHELTLSRIASADVVLTVAKNKNSSRSGTIATTTMSYYNHLGYSATVIDINNITMTIPSTRSPTGEPMFIIEYRIGYTSDVNLNWDTVLNEDSTNPTIIALKSIVKTGNVRMTNTGNEYIIEYIIKHSTLAKNNFSLYYSDLNIIVAKTDKSYNLVHPMSSVGQNLVIIKAENVTGFQYRVIINDPYGQYGDRYININGFVFKVKSTIDLSIKPGVYLHSKDRCMDNGHTTSEHTSDYFDFDVADEKLPLYGTVHLAATLGDINFKQTQVIKDKESEVKERLAALSIRKIEMETILNDLQYKHKQEIMALERENMNLKDDLDREKQLRDNMAVKQKYNYESQTRDDKMYYENRSHARKDVSEFLKWIPALLTGILAVATLMVKMTTVVK